MGAPSSAGNERSQDQTPSVREAARRHRQSGFGAHLQALRVRRGLSQQALAERAGLSVPTIAALEQGLRRHPHPSTVAALAAALDLVASDDSAEALHELARAAPPTATSAPSPSPARSHLPIPPTPLIGRTDDVLAAAARLHPATGQTRLLTLLGPGGVGKTRLALAVAESLAPAFAQGAFFVDLAPLNDARLVPATIAHALQLRESPGQSARQLLLSFLRNQQLLLVLDNFEHLLGAAVLLAELLAACPSLGALVTSRAALRVRSESRFPVLPLPAPAVDKNLQFETIIASPAVRLFEARALTDSPDFAVTPANAQAVAAVCRRLDGLPLALELAVTWLRLFSPEALLTRLEGQLLQLDAGPRDAPARQRTLKATLAWSYELLSPDEQALFRRLSVFANGCMLDAVTAVCGRPDTSDTGILSALSTLADHSLVGLEDVQADQVRVSMLSTVREYAWEQLELHGERAELERAHALYYRGLAEQAEPQLTGRDQVQWLTWLQREHDNVRAALLWAREVGELQVGLGLASAIWRFWWVRGYLAEGRAWLDELLALDDGRATRAAGPADPTLTVRARALNAAGGLAFGQGDYAAARVRYEQSLSLGEQLDDPTRIAMALHNLGYLALEQNDAVEAQRLTEAALERVIETSNARLIAISKINLGEAARQQGDLLRATELLNDGLTLARQRGDRQYVGVALANLGHVARDRADWPAAEAWYAEALTTHLGLGAGYTLGVAACLEGLASVANAHGQARRAAQLLGAASAARDAAGAILSPAARTAHTRAVLAATTALGEGNFQDTWAAGRNLSLARAATLGLQRGQASD